MKLKNKVAVIAEAEVRPLCVVFVQQVGDTKAGGPALADISGDTQVE